MKHMNVFIQPEVAEAIIEVVEELASEVDLYYEDDNLAAATPAFTKMEKMVKMLESAGYAAPETYLHIMERYRKTLN